MVIFIIVFLVFCYNIIPTFLLRALQHIKRRRAGGKKVLYFTFDDGPDEQYTQKILDLLKKYSIKATFFIVSEFAEKTPGIIKKTVQEGHLLGLHSCKHQNALFRGYKFAYSDLANSVFTMKKLGCSVRYYRPPWGLLNLFILYWAKKLNLKIVFWDVMAEDWEEKATPFSIEHKLMERVFPGAVICLHDGRGAPGAPGRTYEALKSAIPKLIAQGYEFRRLDTNE